MPFMVNFSLVLAWKRSGLGQVRMSTQLIAGKFAILLNSAVQ